MDRHFTPKKIVITGALGHIGSQLIRELPVAFPGVHTVMIDNMCTQRYTSVFNLSRNHKYTFIEGDVLQMDLEPIVEGADFVINLAAITNATTSFEHKDDVERVNFNALARTAEACSKVNSPIIHLSSTSVYGDQNDIVDETLPVSKLKPQSPYAETKLKEELYLQELGRTKKLPFVTCRFGTICGTSPGMRFHTAVSIFCWQAAMNQPLSVWTTAMHQKRPYLTLSDATAALKFIIRNNISDRRVYNILSHNLTVKDVITKIKQHIPNVAINLVNSQIMGNLSYEVSSDRIKNRGFQFVGNIDHEIANTIELIKHANSIKHPSIRPKSEQKKKPQKRLVKNKNGKKNIHKKRI
jgi:nucleoside-diphosphate-sugar epimerase